MISESTTTKALLILVFALQAVPAFGKDSKKDIKKEPEIAFQMDYYDEKRTSSTVEFLTADKTESNRAHVDAWLASNQVPRIRERLEVIRSALAPMDETQLLKSEITENKDFYRILKATKQEIQSSDAGLRQLTYRDKEEAFRAGKIKTSVHVSVTLEKASNGSPARARISCELYVDNPDGFRTGRPESDRRVSPFTSHEIPCDKVHSPEAFRAQLIETLKTVPGERAWKMSFEMKQDFEKVAARPPVVKDGAVKSFFKGLFSGFGKKEEELDMNPKRDIRLSAMVASDMFIQKMPTDAYNRAIDQYVEAVADHAPEAIARSIVRTE